ncbi:hypothetical protein RJ640_019749 [Escallonia rubra]|uniref:Uncharacterized protein n=1 Tax=Escallonia rubra TaxID=112253 RepID=A0AA88QXF9_9ASTE|nr:hypothetical protein RJ640_019749 [Escallonia rubra]
MTTIRRFCCNDLLRFSSVNLDHLTETFNMSFYMTYLARWPDYFHVAEAPGNRVMGYIEPVCCGGGVKSIRKSSDIHFALGLAVEIEILRASDEFLG